MQKIILDLDTGIDDALAILYALGEKNTELLGITTTFGNVSLQMATENTLSILEMAKHPQIPVYPGAEHALLDSAFVRREITERIHGIDGLGDSNIQKAKQTVQAQNAVDFLIEAAEQHGDELILITTGPLTNLAQAIKKDKTALKKLNRIVMMGGALTVPGNTSPFAEANIVEDPEAAKIVFESGLPLEVVGLDVTMRTVLTEEEAADIEAFATEESQKVANMIRHYFACYQEILPDVVGCALHDPLAVGVALYPELVEQLPLQLTVDTSGPERGRTIGDMSQLMTKEPTTKTCIQVNEKKFLKLFMDAMKNILSE